MGVCQFGLSIFVLERNSSIVTVTGTNSSATSSFINDFWDSNYAFKIYFAIESRCCGIECTRARAQNALPTLARCPIKSPLFTNTTHLDL